MLPMMNASGNTSAQAMIPAWITQRFLIGSIMGPIKKIAICKRLRKKPAAQRSSLVTCFH